MGGYDGGHGPVDSSQWNQQTSALKDGEVHPEPAPMEQTESGMKRAFTEDPYTDGNPAVVRNFGRS